MPNHFNERWEGPIRGLRLPLTVWNTLRDEGITTIDQLRAVADQLDQKVKQMLKALYEDCEGPIRGLCLPLNAWNVLHRENITTLPSSPRSQTGSSGSQASGQRQPWRSESSLVASPSLAMAGCTGDTSTKHEMGSYRPSITILRDKGAGA